MRTSSVSVIIPCYNRALLVGETIRSVLNQSLAPYEIIAVDDGSKDNTVQVLESFGSRLKIIRQSNAGPGAARNAGLALATGEFIWFMDSDDLATLNKIETQVRALEQTGADIAIAPWIMCQLDGKDAHPETQVLHQKGLPGELPRAFVCNWSTILQTALFRRSFLQTIGFFDPRPNFIAVEDQFMWLKCFLEGAKVIHTPECLIVYRTDGTNKLTDIGLVSERRLVNIATYLLEARQLFIKKGINPCSWFLFRLRLWRAWRDLTPFKSEHARFAANSIAHALGGNPSRHSAYALVQKSRQWLGGFRQRIFGDRSESAMMVGPVNSQQVSLIADLGYSLKRH